MSNFAVGLIGGIASGKTLAAQYFKALGIDVIDTDEIARALVQPETQTFHDIISHFGPHYLTREGALNRAALKTFIFNHPLERIWLEELMHPLIRTEVDTMIARASSLYCIVAIPLLKQRTAYPQLKYILYLEVSRELQLKRLYARDKVSATLAEQIIAAQPSVLESHTLADTIIVNDKNPEDLFEKIKAFDVHIKQEFEKHSKSL